MTSDNVSEGDRHSDYEVRALREVVNDMREEPVPAVDWTQLGNELMDRIQADAPPDERRRFGFGRVAAFLAVAAAVALLIGVISERTIAPTATNTAPSAVNLAEVPWTTDASKAERAYLVGALEPASIVQSGHDPVRFSLPGVVTWTLDPNSRVRVRTTTSPHVVALEQGTIHAEVVPRTTDNPILESFVVETGGTRVAVRGTVFSVKRTSERVVVEVTRGTVQVGSLAKLGSSPGKPLVGPAKAAFTLTDGALLEDLSAPRIEPARGNDQHPPQDDARTTTADTTAEAPVEHTTARSNTIKAPRAARAPTTDGSSDDRSSGTQQPSADSASSQPRPITVDEARGLMVACLSAPSEGDDNKVPVRVTASTQITLQLDDEKRVISMRFNPPVKAELQARCAGGLFGRRLDGQGSVSFGVVFQPPR